MKLISLTFWPQVSVLYLPLIIMIDEYGALEE